MKKIIYLLFLSGICFSCNGQAKKSDYQIALESENQLSKIEEQFSKEQEAGTLTTDLEEKLTREWDAQYEQVKADYVFFFKENINNLFCQKIFASSKWVGSFSVEQLEDILAQADDKFRATDLYKETKERLFNIKTSLPGNMYKNVISKNPDGKEIRLSDYIGKGKYVLLDFWASWCFPCRAEMPGLIEIYDAYKEKNFEIIGYSLDQDEQAWKNGIEQLHMTWVQMSDCNFWESRPVKDYAVQSIPCTFLIDPEGRILERGLRGEELSIIIRKLLNE